MTQQTTDTRQRSETSADERPDDIQRELDRLDEISRELKVTLVQTAAALLGMLGILRAAYRVKRKLKSLPAGPRRTLSLLMTDWVSVFLVRVLRTEVANPVAKRVEALSAEAKSLMR